MKIQAIRKLQFCSGHRVLNHESKCANAHGHNYVAWFHAEANGLDDIGRVIDFSILKERLGKWIDNNWDHTFIIYEHDTELIAISERLSVNKKCFFAKFNPTAENMAGYLLREICPILFKDTNIRIVKIELYETENCKVEVSLNE